MVVRVDFRVAMAIPKKLHIPKINLIPKDPFYGTLIGKIMVWAIQVGRYIIVFTEIIVIMSFASRFKLDRDLTDLTASVTQKKAIIESFGDVESRTRLIQNKLKVTRDLLDSSKATIYLDRLSARIPPGVQLSQLTYDSTQIAVSGRAASSGSLAQFIVALQQEPSFLSISVDKIASGEANDPGISFTVRILVAEKQENAAPATPATLEKPET